MKRSGFGKKSNEANCAKVGALVAWSFQGTNTRKKKWKNGASGHRLRGEHSWHAVCHIENLPVWWALIAYEDFPRPFDSTNKALDAFIEVSSPIIVIGSI